MTRLARTLLCLTTLAALSAPLAATAQEPVKLQQYVYVLHLTARLWDANAWTEADNKAVSQHFNRLVKSAEAGQVILAGRTSEPPDKTFGLVIFEAESADAAKVFMESDPAVVAQVMTATLHPYSIALQRKP